MLYLALSKEYNSIHVLLTLRLGALQVCLGSGDNGGPRRCPLWFAWASRMMHIVISVPSHISVDRWVVGMALT